MKADRGGFAPIMGVIGGKDLVVTTPDIVNLDWGDMESKEIWFKVVWDDGSESLPVKVVATNDPISISFPKGGKPVVNSVEASR